MKRILIPLPSYGFDPTEASIPWKVLTENKYSVTFATPSGAMAAADSLMLTGKGLGPARRLLVARLDAIAAYSEMAKAVEFRNPVSYASSDPDDFDAILLPGGHDKGMREYLESKELQDKIVSIFRHSKPLGAICHGVLLAARSIDPMTNKSVLFGYQTTSLLASQERMAYNLTKWWVKDYYLTYPGSTVQSEVTAALHNPADFVTGPRPVRRDDYAHLNRGFALRDRNYLSARWPGDVYNFSIEFVRMLEGKA